MARDGSSRPGNQAGSRICVEGLVARHRGNGTPALREDCVPAPPSLAEGEDEIAWGLLTFLLSIEGDPPVVALGCSLKVLSLALAKTCAPIIALDPRSGRIPHLESREAGDGAASVFAVCARPAGGLPFRDGSVGQVIVNQVPNRPNCRNGAEPVQISPGLLLEACRVLRADGFLCLVVNQRADRLRPARLRASLTACGFTASEFYMPFPGRHRFTTLAPIASGRAMRSCIDFCVEGNAFRERRVRAWLKILAAAGLLQSLAPEYIVLARKER